MRGMRWLSLCLITSYAVHVPWAIAETVQLSLNPPLDTSVQTTIDVRTRIFDKTSSPISTPTQARHVVDELKFAKRSNQLIAKWRQGVPSQHTDDQSAQMSERVSSDQLVVSIELDDNGQGQRVTGIEPLVEQLKARASTFGVTPDVITVDSVSAGFLRNWNAQFGTIWAMISGHTITLQTPLAFHGQMKLGLPAYDRMVQVVEQTPLSGELQLARTNSTTQHGVYELQYHYAGDVALDDAARAQLSETLAQLAPSVAKGRWLTVKITGQGKATLDAETRMIVNSKISQEMAVEGEGAASVRIERETRIGMMW